MQHLEDERIGESLVRLHHCTEKEVCEALGRQFGLPTFVSLAEKDVDDEKDDYDEDEQEDEGEHEEQEERKKKRKKRRR